MCNAQKNKTTDNEYHIVLFIAFVVAFSVTKLGSGYGNICELRLSDKIEVIGRFIISVALFVCYLSFNFDIVWCVVICAVCVVFIGLYMVWVKMVALNSFFYGVKK
eukprot:383358_1